MYSVFTAISFKILNNVVKLKHQWNQQNGQNLYICNIYEMDEMDKIWNKLGVWSM